MSIKYFGIQWHITDKCDQRCKHCYIYSQKDGKGLSQEEMNFPEIKKILHNYISFCESYNFTPSISLTGGDPLLSESFWPLVDEIQKKGILFSILGNPFHITTEICKKLYEKGCRSYQLSLDGLEETHDNLRKNGSFTKTISSINIIKNSGMTVDIMSTVSKLNSEEIPQLVPLCVNHGVSAFTFARYVPSGDDEFIQFTPLEYKNFLKKMWDVFSTYSKCGTTFPLKDHLWTLFLYEIGKFEIPKEDMIIDGCSCAITSLPILPDGTVWACRRFNSPIGNAANESFSDIFFGKKIDYYRQYDNFELCSKCDLLKVCRGCPAVAYGTYGSFYSKDPQCWKQH